MPNINIVDGRLGGVGKSLFSCCLIHIHQKLKLPYLAIDADPQTYNVHHFYSDTYKLKFSEEDFDRADIAWEASTDEGKNVILNLAASSSELVYEWLTRNRLLQNAGKTLQQGDVSKHIRFINWFLCDASEFSVQQFMESVNTYTDQMTHVLVQNRGKGKESAWQQLLGDPEFRLEGNAQLKEILGRPYIKQIDFPKFFKPVGYDSKKLTFAQAINPDSKELKFLDKQRVESFIEEVETNVTGLGLLAGTTAVEANAANGNSKSSRRGKDKGSEVAQAS